MVLKRVWLFPVATSLCIFGALISGYVIGVINGHFPSLLPFISDGGAYPPEGCIFSQLLNMGSFFMILTCYIRHRQTVEYYGHRLQWEHNRWRIASLILMWIGILSAFGLTFVANFPESEVLFVHGLGAMITFLSGGIYCWGQILIGYCMIPRMANSCVNMTRLLLCCLATVALIFHEIAIIIAPFGPTEPGKSSYHIRWWTPESPYFTNHFVATCSEWIMVNSFILILFSFSSELRGSYCHAPKVVFRHTDDKHITIIQVPTTNATQYSSDW